MHAFLLNELKDTDSIVFDLRDNGGGSIFFVKAIPQLFKPDFPESSSKYLRNKIGYNSLVASQYAEKTWIDSWNESKSGDRHTALKQFDMFEPTSTLGQAYLKPTPVFNNGRSFSAGELFSAAIQDSQTGTIFSEDGETSGSVANVLDTPTSCASVTAARCATGVNNGKLIEDIGVAVDSVAASTGKTTQEIAIELAKKRSLEHNPIYGHRGTKVIKWLINSAEWNQKL
nr:hypothetical protein HK105_000394 [Polyrhizophydium stewartii]